MDRPAIPTQIRRDILVEAGHRCAIPTCRYPDVDVHHIVSWEKCHRHDFDNLIALCPNCHRRADAGEIDRKSLRIYKAKLSAALGLSATAAEDQSSKIVEAMLGQPGYEFEFEFPRLTEPVLSDVEHILRAWGAELLHRHRARHLIDPPDTPIFLYAKNTTAASYEIVRNDEYVLSIRYHVNSYFCGAAHGMSHTRVFNYWKDPLFSIEIHHLLAEPKAIEPLASACRETLLKDPNKNAEWVRDGTAPRMDSFNRFNLSNDGILFTFDEYEVDCYAAGPQTATLSREQLEGIIHPFFLRAIGYV